MTIIRGLLFGISPWNLTNYIVAVLVVPIVLMIAVLIPALRASRVDPVTSITEGI